MKNAHSKLALLSGGTSDECIFLFIFSLLRTVLVSYPLLCTSLGVSPPRKLQGKEEAVNHTARNSSKLTTHGVYLQLTVSSMVPCSLLLKLQALLTPTADLCASELLITLITLFPRFSVSWRATGNEKTSMVRQGSVVIKQR